MRQRTKAPEWLIRKIMDGAPYPLSEPRSIEERINIYENVMADMERKISACREVLVAIRPVLDEERAILAKRCTLESAQSPAEKQREHIEEFGK